MTTPEGSDLSHWPAVGPVADWLGRPPGFPAATGADDPEDPEESGGAAEAGQAAWLRAVFRFSRADGSAMFGPRGRSPGRLLALGHAARAAGDARLASVLDRWRPARRARGEADEGWAPPPLASAGWLDRPLAVLRPDWTLRGDCVAVDHREPGGRSLVEVAGRGVTWLGPGWTSPGLIDPIAPARATYWATGAHADAYEWSFRAGWVEVTRTAALIRGGHLAVLMQTEVGAGPGVGEARWALPDGVEARPDPTLRALVLTAGAGRPTARLVPLGLPESPYKTERGELVVEGREVVLRQRTEGPNRCLALLVAWRLQPPRGWRALTVAENSAACPPGTAFAARVGWGARKNGLIVYKSLGPAALRSVLGHQTRARLVVGAFAPPGDVHPWVKATDG